MNRRALMTGILASFAAPSAVLPQATPEASPQATPEASPQATPVVMPEDIDALRDAMATPTATPEDSDTDDEIIRLPGYVDSVTRSFWIADPGFDVLFGGLLGVAAAGVEFDSDDDASAAIEAAMDAYEDYVTGNIASDPESQVTDFETVPVSIGRLGDERSARATTLFMEDEEFFESMVVVVAVIRKDRWLQMLVGLGVTGVTKPLVDIAEELDDRWPSGDLWDIVPTLDDMPPGMAIEDED